MSLETSRSPRQIGNYDLLAKIAEGGMGAVYRGRCRATGDLVAIKVLPAETARNPLLLKRFEQEFKAASLIDHPNVVKALDYCGTHPTPFLVMEFVDGESLGQKVERDGAVEESEAVRLIGQVCEGLHRAHKQGLIHRDVKPDNIMVTHDGGVAKLTDLGLVKDVEGELNLTRTGRGLGTPHFMAPEQFRNAKFADVRCDVYSLGATLYMLVTGAVPFERTTPLDCWIKKTRDDYPEPRAVRPGVSDRTNWAICRAISADPGKRPSNCREFMEDLTGTGWKASSGTAQNPPLTATAAADDLWYMVYRGADGQPHTVKGSTDSIRRNVLAGSLGDLGAIVVSRTKAGPFVPLRAAVEFRDLVGEPPAPLTARPTPPAGPDDRTRMVRPVESGLAAALAGGSAPTGLPELTPLPADDPDPAAETPPPRSAGGSNWGVWAAVGILAASAGIALAIVLK